MAETFSTRAIGELTFADVAARLSARSILCLPLGAIEQHGPHLPLDTDRVIAEEVTRRLVDRWADEFDLWQLPTIAIGLSCEHDWAAGTLSLSIQSFTALMLDLGRTIAHALPTRHLVIINGHGGNRGILQNLVYELERECGLNVCVIHPLALSRMQTDSAALEIHAGKDETSLMLLFAPHLVRRDLIARGPAGESQSVNDLILDPGVTWPWSSGDVRIARDGVTGDAAAASAEFGQRIVDAILANARPVLARLRENGDKNPAR